MIRFLAITGLIIISLYTGGQTPVGTWSDHLSWNTSKAVAVSSESVYSSTGSSILIFNKKYGEIKRLTRINGLTETRISSVAWSEDKNILIIGYSSANVDLLEKGRIYNIPDIFNKTFSAEKRINRIRTSGKYAFLACSFGIVVLDLDRKEVKDTWNPGPGTDDNEVFDITFSSRMVYTATEKGVYYAERDNPGLVFYGNWNLLDRLPSPDARYTLVLYTGEKLYANESPVAGGGDRLYSVGDVPSLISYSHDIINKSLDPAPDGFTLSSTSSVKYYSHEGTLLKEITSYGKGVPDISQAIVEGNAIWIADVSNGLVMGENMSEFTFLTIPGPASNHAGQIVCTGRKTFICHGVHGNHLDDPEMPFQISVCQNNSCTYFTAENATDAVRVAVMAGSGDHFFVASRGEGLFEFENGRLKTHYNELNSPLQKAPENGKIYITGLASDRSGNLWIVQPGVSRVIKILKSDGTWIVNPLTINAPSAGDILISSNGLKLVLLSAGQGLLILDDNNTPDLFADDRYNNIAIRDNEDNLIRNLFSIAEDLTGNIWIGTDKGPAVFYNNEDLFGEDPRAFRIKIPRNDGSGLADYLLGNETVTAVAVDGANRKWLGTKGSGAYLLSSDETSVIYNYNLDNSPLYSNFITSIAVDNISGDVWFGTGEGVISIRGEATEGSVSYKNVYAFPNPVREDYSGNVTITGLMSDSRVIITDISGNLVFKTISTGGQASWDLTTYNGRRVTTGVYLIFCSNQEGSKAFVTKVLVIR